jgi:OmpA family
MFRATGTGKTEIDDRYSSPGVLKALLYNFDFDDMSSAALKTAHAAFLAERVVPLLANNRGHIWMQGSASRIGANQYNMTLSRTRVRRVGDFLLRSGISASQMQLDAVGEAIAVGHRNDDERDRGVALIILPRAKDAPAPPPIVPPKPLVSDQFRLAILSSISASKTAKYGKYLKGKVGAGFVADVSFFLIWDTTNNQASIYLYVGGGIGVGLAVPGSGTLHGPWNPFTTSKPISSGQFDGFTRFTTAGTGPYTVNWINMCGTPAGVDEIYMMINTGITIGAGISSTVGDLILVEGPDPFSGP